MLGVQRRLQAGVVSTCTIWMTPLSTLCAFASSPSNSQVNQQKLDASTKWSWNAFILKQLVVEEVQKTGWRTKHRQIGTEANTEQPLEVERIPQCIRPLQVVQVILQNPCDFGTCTSNNGGIGLIFRCERSVSIVHHGMRWHRWESSRKERS